MESLVILYVTASTTAHNIVQQTWLVGVHSFAYWIVFFLFFFIGGKGQKGES